MTLSQKLPRRSYLQDAYQVLRLVKHDRWEIGPQSSVFVQGTLNIASEANAVPGDQRKPTVFFLGAFAVLINAGHFVVHIDDRNFLVFVLPFILRGPGPFWTRRIRLRRILLLRQSAPRVRVGLIGTGIV